MYRLYIDETGNADLESSSDPNHRFLSLTGIIVSKADAGRQLYPQLEDLKQQVFGAHPDEPVVLHRKDIMEGKPPFTCLKDPTKRADFDTRIMALLVAVQFRTVTAIIDKQEHLRRYVVWQADPYHYCLEVLLERYVLWLDRRNTTGDVWGEVRGKKHDVRLEDSFTRLWQNGTDFVPRAIVQRAITSRYIKLRPKSANIAGLQIADLIAHPSAIYARQERFKNVTLGPFATGIVNLLVASRYHRSNFGRISGYGIKWLP